MGYAAAQDVLETAVCIDLAGRPHSLIIIIYNQVWLWLCMLSQIVAPDYTDTIAKNYIIIILFPFRSCNLEQLFGTAFTTATAILTDDYI